MIEVLSRHFSTFPADDRQSLRFGRFLMAAGTSVLVSLALLLLAFLGLLAWRTALEGTAGILTLIALFFVLFRTGLNLRFSDPSLTDDRRVTVTVRVATHAKGGDVSVLLARADEALYQGKRTGRNRVVALGA